MIVLHEPKIIFLKAKKVGGTSFEIALSKYATDSSIITPITPPDEVIRQRFGFRGPQNYKYTTREILALGMRRFAKSLTGKSLSKKFYAHIPAAEARKRLGPEVWETYIKISIIRNPFDYMISLYFYGLTDENKRAETSFETWVLMNPEKLFLNNEIYQIEGDNVIDIMIRYDRLKEDLTALEKSYSGLEGLADTFSKISAKGQYRPKNTSIDEMYKCAPRALKLIYNCHYDDIEKYGFRVPQVE